MVIRLPTKSLCVCLNASMGLAKRRMMELDDRGFGEIEGSLCLEHVKDSALVARLSGCVTEVECSVCDRRRASDSAPFAVPYEAVLEVVMETIRYFYSDADATLPWDSEDKVLVGPQSETWDVVDDIISGVFEPDVEDVLGELFVDAIGLESTWTSWSAPGETEVLDFAWDQFAHVAKHRTRYVSSAGRDADPPSMLAAFLELFVLYASDELGLVVNLPAGTEFHRGRLTEGLEKIKSRGDELGPAPDGKAAANRMSPAGISLFYASGDPQTAVAEIAGHGVDPFAVIGKFTSTRVLRVLDFTRQPPQMSPFDLGKREHARLGRFLSEFVRYIGAPVIPDGRQHVEYVPTQVLTEYLRWALDPRLDGLVLPSAQTGRRTFVMFFGREDCGTVGDPEPSGLMKSLLEDGELSGPTFLLDPADVTRYEVKRTYEGVPVRPFSGT